MRTRPTKGKTKQQRHKKRNNDRGNKKRELKYHERNRTIIIWLFCFRQSNMNYIAFDFLYWNQPWEKQKDNKDINTKKE